MICSELKAEVDGKVQVVLLGDSTTIGSVPRSVRPEGPHLEDIIRSLLKAQGDLPACEVINLGQDGEYIRRLLDSGRYDKEVAPLKGVDYIFVRYGLNEINKREDYLENYPKDLRELVARLRKDHPSAVIIPMTLIAYLRNDEMSEKINEGVKKAAQEEGLAVFDIFPASHAARQVTPQGYNYRRFPLAQIPEVYHELVEPFRVGDHVVVLDNELDPLLGDLPGWYSDEHPNFAGYQIIGRETAKYLAPLLRERMAKPGAAPADK
jgi:lysophospholipase L1-like esterase